MADTGRRKELFEQGVKHQPPSFKSDNESRAKLESLGSLTGQGLQGESRGGRGEGELWGRGKGTVRSPDTYSHLSSHPKPFPRLDTICLGAQGLFGGTSSRLSLGGWPRALSGGHLGQGII